MTKLKTELEKATEKYNEAKNLFLVAVSNGLDARGYQQAVLQVICLCSTNILLVLTE